MLHRQHSSLRPDGNIIITGDMGATVERDMKQCVHCGCQWVVQPGSRKQRSWCDWHKGVTCGAPGCMTCKKKERAMQMTHHNYPASYLHKKRIHDWAALQWLANHPGGVILR